MMERVYAFTDEYGAFGWEIDNPDVSTHFIITAIIVKETDVARYRQETEQIRKKHFQTGEMKFSKVGKNHERRKRILADLPSLPFSIFSVCIDKKMLRKYELKGTSVQEDILQIHEQYCPQGVEAGIQKDNHYRR